MSDSRPSPSSRVAELLATPAGQELVKRARQFFWWVVWPSILMGLGIPLEADVKTREVLDMPAACEVCPACPEPTPAMAPAPAEEPENTAGADHDADVPPSVDPALLDAVAE